MLITSDNNLRELIPNVLNTVEGEPSLLDRLTPYLQSAEEWVSLHFTGQRVLEEYTAAAESNAIRRLLQRIIAKHAFMEAVPSLDLILTPNGFGIVSNQNVAPASKERVERLIASLEAERDAALDMLLHKLKADSLWLQSEQSRYFRATLFPFLGLCGRLAIRQHVWLEYQQLHERLIKIEAVLAATYFSEEQMQAFREAVLNSSLISQGIVTLVIDKLRSLELMLVSDMQLHPQSFFDLVNIIRENPTAFPEWHASDTAQLYSPAIFKNKKGSGGYWF